MHQSIWKPAPCYSSCFNKKNSNNAAVRQNESHPLHNLVDLIFSVRFVWLPAILPTYFISRAASMTTMNVTTCPRISLPISICQRFGNCCATWVFFELTDLNVTWVTYHLIMLQFGAVLADVNESGRGHVMKSSDIFFSTDRS